MDVRLQGSPRGVAAVPLTVTRVTHSCVLLDFDGSVVLTDPWFSEKPGYYRGEPLAYTVEQLPKLAAVIVSHDHYDHYDLEAFRAYADKDVPMLVKSGMASKARAAGFTNVIVLEAWDQWIGYVKVVAAPGAHSVPELSYVLQRGGLTVFFGGDTLLIPELTEVGRRFGPIDLALLPVNGLCIRPANDLQIVMNAREAASLCNTLQARVAVPLHYPFTGGPEVDRDLLKYTGTAEEFAEETARVSPSTEVHVLAPGEPLRLMPALAGAAR
jgi:L-ascorbate metabolism protein UlaG (beta-lactamase superfamily)